MKTTKVKGEDYGRVFLYTLSTCIWCKKTKEFLKNSNVEFEYCDVDLLDEKDQELTEREMRELNPGGGFPTIIINNNDIISGYQPEKISDVLGL
ncbi:MAG: glutaredoxin family protein [Candidatus Margulisbacteria bacterium]|nr:glutaredoxin family protein [Candidatus Margulisiibacteriota bacterium]